MAGYAKRAFVGGLAPGVKIAGWHLASGSGTTTGATTGPMCSLASGPNVKPLSATLTVSSGSVAWKAGGGLEWVAGTSNAYLTCDPATGSDRDWYAEVLSLSALAAGQAIYVGFDIELPAGYAAANTGTRTLLSIGGFGTGQSGWALRYNSGEVPQLHYRAPGASAAASAAAPVGVALADAKRQALVFELVSAGSGLLNYRCHLVTDSAATSSSWVNSVDLVQAASGGTAAPGLPAGLPIAVGGRRIDATYDTRLSAGEILRGVWIARTPSAPTTAGLQMAREVMARPHRPPLSAILWSDESAESDLLPDGNADETFGIITLADMHVAVNGDRAIAEHPTFSIECEPKPIKNTVAPSLATWVSTSDYEGANRQLASPGGLKFGRTKLAPASASKPAFLLSAYRTDNSNRNRCEFYWNGPDVYLPRGVPLWIAERVWFDYPIDGTVQHTTLMQLYHAAPGSGLNPAVDLSITGDRMQLSVRTCAVQNMVQSDQVNRYYKAPGLSQSLRGRWVDIVIEAKIHWDAAQNGYFRVYFDDTLTFSHVGPVGFRGPAATGQPTYESLRFGPYPGQANVEGWSPDVVRTQYIRRAFACRNVGNYTLAQVRAALQG